jgi:hypothetical protein
VSKKIWLDIAMHALLFLALTTLAVFSQAPPKVNNCRGNVVRELTDSVVNYNLCDFELVYQITPRMGQQSTATLLHLPAPMEINIMCINETVPPAITDQDDMPVEFIHLAEAECKADGSLKFDLYLPIVHLMGTYTNISVISNGEMVEILL